MLTLNRKEAGGKRRLIIASTVAVFLLIGGLYTSSLLFAPEIAPLLVTKPVDVSSLSAPTSNNNRIVIPRIGVNVAYSQGISALDTGAEWRAASSGNPEDGGNFVLVARRFSLQPTPMATINQSPFFNLNKLSTGDKIVVDYKGKRYGYEINKSFTVNPSEIEIEARTNEPTLTLYGLDNNDNNARLIIQAKRLGEIATN